MGSGDVRSIAVLADPTRVRILEVIRGSDDGRALVGGLADELKLRQPTISHHMKTLLADGIVVRQPEGRRVWYSIAPDHEERVLSLLGPAGVDAPPDLERIAADLAVRYRGSFSPETVRLIVTDSDAQLSRETRAPALRASRTAAFAAMRLDALRRESGIRAEVPEVLFVCVQNAGRSQLAAGILRQLAGERVTVRTAGSAPGPDVRASIVHALDEIGVSIGGEFPKPLTDEMVRAADVVVTMGCGDACPIYPGRCYLDWDLEDPVGKPDAVVRRIRDDIDRRVRELIGELLPQ